jgi:hypothetical protein
MCSNRFTAKLNSLETAALWSKRKKLTSSTITSFSYFIMGNQICSSHDPVTAKLREGCSVKQNIQFAVSGDAE